MCEDPKVKNRLLLATALTALSFSAFAADLPARTAAPYAPAPSFSWAGAYVGGSVGAAVSSTGFHDNDDWFDNQLQAGHTSFGAMGGLYAGYNVQMRNFVYGVEASGNLMSGKLTVHPYGGSDYLSAQTAWNASLKVRAGLAMDKTLVYIAAGPAVTSSKVGAQFSYNVSPTDYTTSGSKTSNVFGAAFAAGVEHALSDKLIARLQLEHVASGKSSAVVASDTYASSPGNYGFAFTRSTTAASAGLAYKF